MRFLGVFAPWAAFVCAIVAALAGTSSAQDASSASSSSSSTTSTSGLGGTRKLFTSSVAYCSAPIAILVTDLNLVFYPSNSTLEFQISAASTQDNLNVSVALSVDAYGIGVFDVNIDLCDIAAGILCPLPKYQFSGGGIFPVPEQIGSEVPAIAYNIPDLEAVATVQLTDVSDGSIVGCVQATLSNGHTARQSGVKWATVGLALLALFSSLLHTSIAQSIGAAQWRIVDVMLAIQQPAITALLSLNYPVVYLEYGSNFAWALGLVNIPSLQNSITQTRYNTGGHGTALFGKNLTAATGRDSDPFSDTQSGSSSSFGQSIDPASLGFGSLATKAERASNGVSGLRNAISTTVAKPAYTVPYSSYADISTFKTLLKRAQYAPNTGPGGTLNTGGSGETLPLVTGNTTIDGGIGQFAERSYVAPDNVFLTSLVSMLILLAIVVGALLVLYLIALAARLAFYRKYRPHGGLNTVGHWGHRVSRPSEFLGTIVLPTLGRYLLIIFPVYLIFAFWQWYAGDSWVGHLVAALILVILLCALAAFIAPLFVHTRRAKSADALYYNDVAPLHGSRPARRWGPMAHAFRPRFYWFTLAFLLWWLIRACFLSFAQGHGTRQAIGLLVAECLLFIALCVFRVGRDKKSDFVFIFMCFARIAAWAVCIAFIPQANVRTIPRAIVAYVLLVVTAIPIIYLFFITLLDLISPLLRRKRRDIDHEKPEYSPEMQERSNSSSEHQRNFNDSSLETEADSRTHA